MTKDKEIAQLHDASTGEVLSMVLGYEHDDITIGRMPVGMDESDFDLMARDRLFDTPNHGEGAAGDELDLLAGADDDKPSVFEEPAPETFPVFKSALRHFQEQEAKPKMLRVDTEQSYQQFASEKAVQEIDRRLRELRDAFEEHLDDYHGSRTKQRRQLSKWDDVLGASEAITKIHAASSADEAVNAMPQVPLDLPPAFEGKIKCWVQGDHVVCSLRFLTPEGGKRIATMAARPRYDVDAVAAEAMQAGVDPITVLGVLPDLAAVACGKRLVKDIAGAALDAQRRADVCNMDEDEEPVLLVGGDAEATAPLAALMYVQQRADAGDAQAQHEMRVIEKAANTPSGRQIAAPLLSKARERLALGRARKAKKPTFMQRYTMMLGCL